MNTISSAAYTSQQSIRQRTPEEENRQQKDTLGSISPQIIQKEGSAFIKWIKKIFKYKKQLRSPEKTIENVKEIVAEVTHPKDKKDDAKEKTLNAIV